MKKQLLIYLFLFSTIITSAQLYEGGVFLGGSNYIGDIGPTTYINPNRIAVGGVAKFNWTPRITFRGTMIYSRLHADDSKAESSFRRNRTPSPLRFRNSIVEGALGIEFSFFKYSLSKIGYTSTPYIIAQIGAVNYSVVSVDSKHKRVTSLIFPVGLGYKMKLARNVGVAFETSFRYTFKDVIDGNNHAIPGRDFGSAYNDDWYVFTGVTLVYAFGRPGCYKENSF